jgi:CHAT domain-containing protein
MHTTTLVSPTSSDVLDNLPNYDIVHFACHGFSDSRKPSLSHLILRDTNLTVEQIIRKKAASAQIAYLSACSTAYFKDPQLSDESIHIASSFQLAGFTHVIGTLWETEDETCQVLAKNFYEQLFAKELGWNGTWDVNKALHQAVSQVRFTDKHLPLLWAPFVCFGG